MTIEAYNAATDIMKTERKERDFQILTGLPSAQPEREHTMEEFMYGQDMGNPEDGSL